MPYLAQKARSLLGWSRETLAELSNVPVSAVLTYERIGHVEPAHAEAIHATFKSAGVEFTYRNEPRLRLAGSAERVPDYRNPDVEMHYKIARHIKRAEDARQTVATATVTVNVVAGETWFSKELNLPGVDDVPRARAWARVEMRIWLEQMRRCLRSGKLVATSVMLAGLETDLISKVAFSSEVESVPGFCVTVPNCDGVMQAEESAFTAIQTLFDALDARFSD